MMESIDPPASPDIWPAYLWISLGVLIYLGAPHLYDPLAAAIYFVAGSVIALIALGTATRRFNLMLAPVLRDLLPTDSLSAPMVTMVLRWLALGMEGLAVMHLSRIAVIALAPGA